MTPNQDRPLSGRTESWSPESRTRRGSTPTIYDVVIAELRDHGWVKGAPRRGEAMCLVEAIDAAVGVKDHVATVGTKFARAGRVGAHLRDLLGERNLAAWSDEPTRTLDDVLGLLAEAAIAFPED